MRIILPFTCHHFLHSYKMIFNCSKRLSSRKQYVSVIREGKDKEKERKWGGEAKWSVIPIFFPTCIHMNAHIYTLEHAESPLRLWVLSSASDSSSHYSACTAAPKEPLKCTPTFLPVHGLSSIVLHKQFHPIIVATSSIVQGNICSENGLLMCWVFFVAFFFFNLVLKPLISNTIVTSIFCEISDNQEQVATPCHLTINLK